MRRLMAVAGLAVVAAASLGAGVAGAGDAARSASATPVTRWSPFGTSGSIRPGLSVVARGGGDCWTGSFVVHKAYRCIADNEIHDPCWRDTGAAGRVVVCADAPTDRQVVRLRVTKSMSRASSAPPNRVWALRVPGSGTCTMSQGASGLVNGKPVSYLCRHGAILGGIDRAHRRWRARYVTKLSGARVQRVPVSRAWIGRTGA